MESGSHGGDLTTSHRKYVIRPITLNPWSPDLLVRVLLGTSGRGKEVSFAAYLGT